MTLHPARDYDWRRYYQAAVASRGNWKLLTVSKKSGHDNVPWDVLQLIKAELLGAGAYCVEVYPPGAKREAHVRWLWEVPRELVGVLP